MAIGENITSQYYKVLEDECYVQDGFVFVAVARYPNQEEREREKEREERLSSFLSNVNNRYLTLVTENEDNETLSEEEVEYIAEIERVLYAVENFAVITASQQPATISISDGVKQELVELGYKDEFLSDPIVILDRIIVNCGRYDGKPLTLEYLYNKLKPQMAKFTNV